MNNAFRAILLTGLTGLAISATGLAADEAAGGGGHTAQLLRDVMPGKGTLTVTSPSFREGGDIPFENTQYRGNRFPGVSWSKGPAGTRSYVVVMQGILGRATSIHLNLFDVPADVTSLAAGMTKAPAGAMFGASLHGVDQGYVGPHTHNFGKQQYYIQVFALDTIVPASVQPSFPALQAAMNGHVLASGAIMGLATMDPDSQEAADLRKKQAGDAAKAAAK